MAQALCHALLSSLALPPLALHPLLRHHHSFNLVRLSVTPPNPQGTIIEVNVSDLGLVTPGGKVVWGKYAQITNNPETDGARAGSWRWLKFAWAGAWAVAGLA